MKVQLLVVAIKKNDSSTVLKILNDGLIEINEQFGQQSLTPLHFAIHLEGLQVIRVLLAQPNIDVNLGDSDGDTPIIHAVRSGKSDIKTLAIVGILLADPRCQITTENKNGVFPLAAAAGKGFKETTKLLIADGRLKLHSISQLLVAVRIAMSSDFENLADLILDEMDVGMRLALAAAVGGDPEIAALAQFLAQNSDESSNSSSSSKSASSDEEDEETVQDVSGKTVRIGDTVKILDSNALKLSSILKEEFIDEVANRNAIVHGIKEHEGGPLVFLDILQTPHLGYFSPKSIKFVQSRRMQAVADGKNRWVGSYVKVAEDKSVVKELSKGHGNWVARMAECCGKTGKVFEIDQDGDIHVVFGWGAKLCFNPMALLCSTMKKVEAKDSVGNFITHRSSVVVMNDAAEFKRLQLEHGLWSSMSADKIENEMKVVGKRVLVSHVRIKYARPEIIVGFSQEGFVVAPSTITFLSKTTDSEGKEFGVGDQVQVIENLDTFKELQTDEFGGWSDRMNTLVKKIGLVVEMDVNAKYDATDVSVKVKFDAGTFHLNPKALVVVVQESEEISREQFRINGEEMTIIPRNELWVGEEVGEGAFGCVVKGTWNDSPCAIKQVKSIVLRSIGRDDIIREATIQYSLKHPNIVQLFGISIERDLWMVMRFIDGTDLMAKTFPKESGEKSLSFEVKVKVARQACNALAYIHDKGFLHSDIKPQNMMVENQTGYLYLCDFGISRYLGNVSVAEYSTLHTNTFRGTMYYIAPECHQTDSVTGKYVRPTFKADIWSLGIVFAELFTEQKLFAAMPNLMQMMCGNFAGVDLFVEKIDKRVKPIVEKALVKVVTDRPTAQEMQQFFLGIKIEKK